MNLEHPGIAALYAALACLALVAAFLLGYDEAEIDIAKSCELTGAVVLDGKAYDCDKAPPPSEDSP